MSKDHTKPDLEVEFPVIMQAAIDNKLTPEEAMFMLAIRMTEQGGPGYEYGVKVAKGTNLRRQAGEAAATIVNNRERYDKYVRSGGTPNYTDFFAYHGGKVGNGWAPIKDVPKDEADLNSNWVKNQDNFVAQLLPTWMPRVKEWYGTAETQSSLEPKEETVPIWKK